MEVRHPAIHRSLRPNTPSLCFHPGRLETTEVTLHVRSARRPKRTGEARYSRVIACCPALSHPLRRREPADAVRLLSSNKWARPSAERVYRADSIGTFVNKKGLSSPRSLSERPVLLLAMANGMAVLWERTPRHPREGAQLVRRIIYPSSLQAVVVHLGAGADPASEQ